jgi:hypothetical protein
LRCDRSQKARFAHRFGYQFVKAGGQNLAALIFEGVCSIGNHAKIFQAVIRANAGAYLTAAQAGHADIEQNRIETAGGKLRQRFFAARGFIDFVTGAAQEHDSEFAIDRMVIYDKDAL